MKENVVIVLEGQQRSDGSWFISSPDVPMFSVTGATQKEALDNAIAVLPKVLSANYGTGELRQLPALRDYDESDKGARHLPAYMIAAVGCSVDGSTGASGNG